MTDVSTLVSTLTRGVELQARGEHAEAERIFTEVLQSAPNNVAALCSLGILYVNSGRQFEAMRLLLQATQLLPSYFPAWAALAAVFEARGAYGKALSCCNRALDIEPSSVDTLIRSGRLLAYARRFGEALQRFNRALQADPANETALAEKRGVLARFTTAANFNYGWAVDAICSRDRFRCEVVFELGSRDAIDAIWLGRLFPGATVYAFEAHPDSAQTCRDNVEFSCLKNVVVVENAVSNAEGQVSFFPFDLAKHDNVGASSMFQHNLMEPGSSTGSNSGLQAKIDVAAIRLDRFCQENGVDRVDVICMDLQGAERIALEGLGDRLRTVSYIVSEASHVSCYTGGCTFADLAELLACFGFTPASAIPPDPGFWFEFNVIWENASVVHGG